MCDIIARAVYKSRKTINCKFLIANIMWYFGECCVFKCFGFSLHVVYTRNYTQPLASILECGLSELTMYYHISNHRKKT